MTPRPIAAFKVESSIGAPSLARIILTKFRSFVSLKIT